MKTAEVLALLAGMLALPLGTAQAQTAASRASGIDVSTLSMTARENCLEYVKAHGQNPIDYVVGKFANHRIVIIGEQHEQREALEFVAQLIDPLHRKAGVRCLASEFLRSRNTAKANAIVTATRYDANAVTDLYRDFAWVWGHQEYMDIIKAIWQLNQSLPQGATKFRIVGLDFPYEELDLLDAENPAEAKRVLSKRDEYMTQAFKDQVGVNEKALVHTGLAHAFTRYRQPLIADGKLVGLREPRMGCLLVQAYGQGNVFNVRMHGWDFPLATLEGRSETVFMVLDGLIDRTMKDNQDRPVGFDVAGSPFAGLRDAKSYYFCFQKDVVFADLADGYVFLKHPNEISHSTWAKGFINQTNFAKARKMAIIRGWMKKDQEMTPEELDSFFKAAMESH